MILSTDHVSVQLKNSLEISRFPTIPHNERRFKK